MAQTEERPIDSVALQQLLDERAIRRVILTYPRGMDRADAEVVSSIYFEDALDFHGSRAGLGVDYANHIVENMHRGGRFFTMHFMGDTFFEWDGAGEVAHTETYVRASHTLEQDGEQILELFFGRYLDRFERRNGEWRIARRVTIRDYMCNTPVTPMMPERPFQGRRDLEDPSYQHLRMEILDFNG